MIQHFLCSKDADGLQSCAVLRKTAKKFDFNGSGLKIPHSNLLDLPELCRTIN